MVPASRLSVSGKNRSANEASDNRCGLEHAYRYQRNHSTVPSIHPCEGVKVGLWAGAERPLRVFFPIISCIHIIQGYTVAFLRP
jgi:hypothetical protein